LARVLRGAAADVVVAYGYRASMLTRLAVHGMRPKPAVVVGVRGEIPIDTPDTRSLKVRFGMRLEGLMAPLVTLYDANSRGALRRLHAAGVPAERLVYIPNGIDVGEWAPPAPVERRRGRIACVARFAPVKDHETLLQAVALLADRGVPFELHLAGDGPTLPAMRSLAARLGVGDGVIFRRTLAEAELRALLATSLVFCLPSRSEGMPGSVLEAMAAGVCVVGSAVNGIEDLVVANQTGLLVPPGDSVALADALEAALKNHERSAGWGMAGRARAGQRFSLTQMVRAKERLYRTAAKLAA
jgi:glycosyltransferase involved in cell wall biosynthesis